MKIDSRVEKNAENYLISLKNAGNWRQRNLTPRVKSEIYTWKTQANRIPAQRTAAHVIGSLMGSGYRRAVFAAGGALPSTIDD